MILNNPFRYSKVNSKQDFPLKIKLFTKLTLQFISKNKNVKSFKRRVQDKNEIVKTNYCSQLGQIKMSLSAAVRPTHSSW